MHIKFNLKWENGECQNCIHWHFEQNYSLSNSSLDRPAEFHVCNHPFPPDPVPRPPFPVPRPPSPVPSPVPRPPSPVPRRPSPSPVPRRPFPAPLLPPPPTPVKVFVLLLRKTAHCHLDMESICVRNPVDEFIAKNKPILATITKT